ncbi:hypothetical protein B5X24_HaOG215896 [Helicoverpa armigera]|nr:hypothetical protein B5X24_HaOG215896 [Helicoverpa armigera]
MKKESQCIASPDCVPTRIKPPRPLETIRAQCPRRGRVGRTRTFMEDGRCATCEALGRRSLSTKLLQVATAQAHMKTCSHAASPPEQVHDSDLASRALAAKRRKSIAGFKLNLTVDSQPKSTSTEQPRSPFARRNTWCSAKVPHLPQSPRAIMDTTLDLSAHRYNPSP